MCELTLMFVCVFCLRGGLSLCVCSLRHAAIGKVAHERRAKLRAITAEKLRTMLEKTTGVEGAG